MNPIAMVIQPQVTMPRLQVSDLGGPPVFSFLTMLPEWKAMPYPIAARPRLRMRLGKQTQAECIPESYTPCILNPVNSAPAALTLVIPLLVH